MRGEVRLATLTPETRMRIKQQLVSIGAELWDRAADSLKQAVVA